MKLIVYGSKYGTAKNYAEELSRKTGICVKSHEEVTDINRYDTVIYIGALYAGGVLGMKKTFSKLSQWQNKRIIIATVGLADTKDTSNTDNIKNGIKKQIPEGLYENAHIFHLRGGIDYSRLSLMHKTMMGLLYKKAVGLPEEKKTAEVKAMIETYNKKAYYVNLDDLDAIIDDIPD
ncbi:MAG: flavodoxin domain-containing protein [Eubacteriales bacterium]